MELELAAEELFFEIQKEAEITNETQQEIFFKLYSEAGRENGEFVDLQPCSSLAADNSFRIDGYYLDVSSQELILAISNFHPTGDLVSINKKDVTDCFKHAEKLFKNALDDKFISALEEQSPTFQVAQYINENIKKINRIKFVLFSNAHLSMRGELVKAEEVNGFRFVRTVFDLKRYNAILNSKNANDPITIDFMENGLAPLSCLKVSGSSDKYDSYLAVVPGILLAEIYRKYGARLLEANVRTFLQARTKVNQGIIKTIADKPENFFAYNNGLTATAAEVEVSSDGTKIIGIEDLQIVNGGQTTASILYASDVKKSDLNKIFVQMKLSRPVPDGREELTRNISRYANSQNKVSEADLFASSKFHIHMEQLSRRIIAPATDDQLAGTKWFYERARGQYRDEQAYMSKTKRDKFQAEYPKNQLILKPDLAKYEMTFKQKPNLVSKGAGACFSAFAKAVDANWTEDANKFGEAYYKNAMSRALLFRWTDKHIASSDWYKEDRGYKSQIITYTLSTIQMIIKSKNMQIDFRLIWNSQTIPNKLMDIISELAPLVGEFIKQPPPEVRNIAEYCKREYCWTHVKKEFIDYFDPNLISECLISKNESAQLLRAGIKLQKTDNAIEAQKFVYEKLTEWPEILNFGRINKCLSPNEVNLMEKASNKNKIHKITQDFEFLKLIEAYNKVLIAGYGD